VERAVAHFSPTHDVIDVDGARILFGDGWGLLRSSNTQPVHRGPLRGPHRRRLEEIRTEVEGWLRDQGVDV
jgi:phosphomannomutase / phosphoglucomutase